MKHDFWKSAGLHLLERNDEGRLRITADYLRAYYTRPEVHPVEESCASEIALHDALMADPFMPVDRDRLAGLADKDAVETYSFVLNFRDCLIEAGSIEAGYIKLISPDTTPVPPVFLDQMVHVILRNILRETSDPMRLRAAELFFRTQTVSTDDGRIMLADEEIVQMHGSGTSSSAVAQTGLGQLLAQSDTAPRSIELDVLNDDNANLYWERSDRFDTVIDFRLQQPAPDAFARVIELWLAHMTGHEVNVQPMARIDDDDWRWHIGLDRDATALLNRLYEGQTPPLEDLERILGLFQMRFSSEGDVLERVRGHPVYLGLAMSPARRVRMKPQNLLMNLPLFSQG